MDGLEPQFHHPTVQVIDMTQGIPTVVMLPDPDHVKDYEQAGYRVIQTDPEGRRRD